tara:strand:- start:2311 stop:2487 length:177 start_codon:yes stop_codon:yes gene_type:complete
MEEQIWCNYECYTDDEEQDANYHEDGNDKVYLDNNGQTYVCPKHHWSCAKCNKIVQIG